MKVVKQGDKYVVADTQVTGLLIVNNGKVQGKGMPNSSRNSKRVTKKLLQRAFPFLKIPKGLNIDMSQIDNPLETIKIVNPKITTLSQGVDDAYKKSPRIRELIDGLVKLMQDRGIHFDIEKIGKPELQPIGKATFNSITQRILDLDHLANILEELKEELLSPAFAVKSKDGTLSTFDTMHGLHIVGLLAKHGLWGNDVSKWQNFLFPFFVINGKEEDPFFADDAAFRRNGKGQKKWEEFDYHRIKVAAVRRARALEKDSWVLNNDEYLLAEKLQTLCEKYEAIPLPDGHENYEQVGTLTRLGALKYWADVSRNNDLDEMAIPEFILATHKKYWHGTLCDSAMFGLYGHLYLQMNLLKNAGVKMKGKEWNDFLDRFHATILFCFTTLKKLKNTTETAYNDWFVNAKPALAAKMKKKTVSCPHDAALAVVLKLMKYVGETHPAVNTNSGLSYNENNFHLLDSVLSIDDNNIGNRIKSVM